MIDLVYLNKGIAQLIMLNSQQMANSQCVADDNLNSSDAQALLQFLVLNISELPVKG